MRGPIVDYSDDVVRGDIDHRFGPTGAPSLTQEQQDRIAALREHARLYARHVASSCPPSWERDEALHCIDNAASFAARSIARHE